MKTSQVLSTCSSRGRQFSHINIGVTRTVSRVNVIAHHKGRNVQFCPFTQVESELQIFCDRFNVRHPQRIVLLVLNHCLGAGASSGHRFFSSGRMDS